jgi:hypothetical protein
MDCLGGSAKRIARNAETSSELKYRVRVQFVLLRVLMTLVVQRGGGGFSALRRVRQLNTHRGQWTQ